MQSEVVPVKKQEVSTQETTRPGRVYAPSVDIAETADALWLWADVPGVDEKSIDVRLENGVLTVEGRVGVGEYADLRPLYTEYNVGNWQRSFRVGEAIDLDRIRAKVTDGVLEIELPKAAAARARRIEVRAS
jgi:HSP20 family molecular chaperone IbpA